MSKTAHMTITLLLLFSTSATFGEPANAAPRIEPWSKNPAYWSYGGRPVLLLGGSKDDNLFQIPDVEEHLDELVGVGGNFVRNTMSARQDAGFEAFAYKRLADGRFDLEQWNAVYWDRFERFLSLCEARGIIVQIEVWDRFDYSQQHWEQSPWRPANNVNYTPEESGLANRYPAPAWRDQQPFFHTIPGMPRYNKKLDGVRALQERRVRKMLSHSLNHGNVLYCMDNETSTPPAWGEHWMQLIQQTAKERGVTVYTTDMFDDGYQPWRSNKYRRALDTPERYTFLDISQVNSRCFNEDHWNRFRWFMQEVDKNPRPVNHVKIYSDGETTWGSGTPVDGVERFWRNLLGGAAACRFHRPGGGIGLNDTAKACIKAARLVEERVKFWDVTPAMDLLTDREEDEAYVAAGPGRGCIVFFTDGGAVGLDLGEYTDTQSVQWVNVRTGALGPASEARGGEAVMLAAPGAGPWVVTVSHP